jgi:hypothetical protein
MPPAVRPDTRYFWIIKKMTRTGNDTNNEPAAKTGQFLYDQRYLVSGLTAGGIKY